MEAAQIHVPCLPEELIHTAIMTGLRRHQRWRRELRRHDRGTVFGLDT